MLYPPPCVAYPQIWSIAQTWLGAGARVFLLSLVGGSLLLIAPSKFLLTHNSGRTDAAARSEPQSISRTSGAAARRFELTYNGLTAEDCLSATTQTLLRERYRELSAVYTRMKRVVDPETTGQFVLENTEGNGDIASRVHNLNRCIAYHVREVECLRAVINGNMELKAKWKCGSRNASLFTCGGE